MGMTTLKFAQCVMNMFFFTRRAFHQETYTPKAGVLSESDHTEETVNTTCNFLTELNEEWHT
jgi:hypothetical protein